METAACLAEGFTEGEAEDRMKKLVTCKEMKDLDSTTIREMEFPPGSDGAGSTEGGRGNRKVYGSEGKRILVVCGSGNNGGDGMLLPDCCI